VSYKPEEHWNANAILHLERGESINNYCFDIYKNQERQLIDILKKIKFESVLEIGCGFGRVTNLILNEFDVDRYVATDISQIQLDNAREHLHRKHIVDYIQVDITIPSKLPSKIMNNKFDLVIATEVLMHILPRDIFNVIGTMIYVSNNHVINIDYHEEEDKELRSHNFKHDYEHIYNAYRPLTWNHSVKSLEVIEIEDTKQCLYHATVLGP
jgi:SAM-dependent methyltransferase